MRFNRPSNVCAYIVGIARHSTTTAFLSYTGKRVVWYAGWQKTGNFGLKLNLLNSRVQVV